MSDVLNKIINKLSGLRANYELVEHPPVITSEDAARIRDSDMSMGAKALVFLADKKPILIVVPGNRKLDMAKFKKFYQVKDLIMADEIQLKEITGLTKGAVPPMGSIFGIKTYYAQDFTSKDKVAFNAGSHTHSIFMKAQDLLNIEKPEIGDFIK